MEVFKLIAGILFDFDMTLIDTSPALLFNINKIAGHFGLPTITMDFLMENIGLNSVDFWIAVLGSYNKEYMDYYKSECMPYETPLMKHMPGSIECITCLRKIGIKVGCASNRVHPERVVEAKGLTALMDCIVGADTVAHPKPAPDVLLKGAELLCCRAEDVIYVGDTEYDIESARNAGMKSVVFTTSNPREKLEKEGAWRIIDGYSELIPLLKEEKLL